MIRNLKVLGIAMIASFAFSAVAASGASAQEGMLTSDGPVTLTGVEVGGPETNRFEAFGQEVKCPGAEYTGHKFETTPHQFLESGATTTTITPHYEHEGNEGCESGSGANRTVVLNGCDYEFYDFTTAGEDTYSLTAGVVCPEGQEIEVKGGACVVRVPSQTELTGLHATNEENGKILIHGTIHNVTAHTCLGLQTKEAKQHQGVTVEGHNDEEETTEVEISH